MTNSTTDEKNLRIVVGSQLKAHRLAQKLTTRELAEISGLNHATINKIENGRWAFTIDTIDKVCNALKVTITIS